MDKTTITISNQLARSLNRLKYLFGDRTIEEVIKRYIKEEEENGETKRRIL
jgi:hypothetical protein